MPPLDQARALLVTGSCLVPCGGGRSWLGSALPDGQFCSHLQIENGLSAVATHPVARHQVATATSVPGASCRRDQRGHWNVQRIHKAGRLVGQLDLAFQLLAERADQA
jgi:hypothetical protein